MSCAPHAPRRNFTRVASVQRAPRRGNKLPAQGKRAQRATPWVRQTGFRCAPGGGKSSNRGVQIERQISSVIAFAPSGGVSETHLPNPGCRSLRSLALGWELVAPSGRALNACHTRKTPSGRTLDACHTRKIPSGRALNAGHTRKNPAGRAWDACGGTSVCYRTTVARRIRTSSKGRLCSSRPTHWMRSTTARPSVISPNTVYWPSR